jgi:opacity protein-like surface antigen
MKRATIILAATAVGALTASAPARADDSSLADRILNAVYGDLGITAKADDAPQGKQGFFVGLHSGLGAESGLAPDAAGLAIPLEPDVDNGADSVTANGYYVFTTDFSLGTYVGGGFGKFNLASDPLANAALPRGNFAYQGMAGLTYSLTPSMALGLEYRYSETVNNAYLTQSTLPPSDEEKQSVTLRFDFLLN